MSVKNGEVVPIQFTTRSPTTGGKANADALPTAILTLNGADTAEVVVVANVATGRYSATVTIPVGYVEGDKVQIVVSATIGGVAAEAIVWSDRVTTVLISEVADGILDQEDGIEPGVTLRGATRAMAAMLAGLLTGANASTAVMKALGHATKERVTMTLDEDGNRLTVVLDLTDAA